MVCLRSCTFAESVGLTGGGGGLMGLGNAAFLLFPVSHMTRTIATATPMMTRDCRCLGMTPRGFGARSSMRFGVSGGWTFSVIGNASPSIQHCSYGYAL